MSEAKEKSQDPKDLPRRISDAAPSLQKFIGILSLAALSSYLLSSIHSPQFYEDLTIGNWIRAQGSVPTSYIWGFSGHGFDWRSTSWLWQLLLSVWEESCGSESFILLKFALLAASFFALYACYRRCSQSTAVAGILTTVVGCGVFTANEIGAHIFAYSLFIFLIERLFAIREKKFKFRLREGIVLFLLSSLYANIHFSSLIFLFIALILLLDSRLCCKEVGLGRFFLVFFILLLGHFCSPYFGMQLLTSGEKILHFFTIDLGYQLKPGTVFHFPIAFIVLLWLVFASFWHSFPYGITRVIAFLAIFSSVLAFAHLDAAPLALFFTGLAICSIWGNAQAQGRSLGNLGEGFQRLGAMFGAFPVLGSVFLIICILVVNLSNLWKLPFTKTLLPVAEVDYLLEEQLDSPVLHDAFVGSYLVYRFSNPDGSPKRTVLLSEVSREINPGLFVSYFAYEKLEKGWEAFFESYAPRTVICQANSLQHALLSKNPRWKLEVAYGQKLPSRAAESLLEKGTFGWLIYTRRSESPSVSG